MKKLLSLMLCLCMLSSLVFVFASCDLFGSKSNSDDDDDEEEEETALTNAPTTSKGSQITREEWAGMLGATNYTCISGSTFYYADNGSYCERRLSQPSSTYYTVKNGKYYSVIQIQDTAVAVETEAFSSTLGDVILGGKFTVDDYDNLVYNGSSYTYKLNAITTCYFTFLDGVIQSISYLPNSYNFSDYGTTTVQVPSFKVDTEDEDDNDEPGSDYTDSKQITYNDWVDMLDANNCYVYGEEEGHYYTVANNALESPGSIIAANNGKIYVFISDGQGGWSSGSDIGQTGEVNLNFLFFRGSANDSDYSSLQYDESKGCYIYQDTYEMYFENGYLCKLVFGSNTMYITSYGEMSVDLSRITFPN